MRFGGNCIELKYHTVDLEFELIFFRSKCFRTMGWSIDINWRAIGGEDKHLYSSMDGPATCAVNIICCFSCLPNMCQQWNMPVVFPFRRKSNVFIDPSDGLTRPSLHSHVTHVIQQSGTFKRFSILYIGVDRNITWQDIPGVLEILLQSSIAENYKINEEN